MSQQVRLDLNCPVFLRQRFALDRDLQHAVLDTLRKLSQMTWQQIYRDSGLRWEVILSRSGPHGGRIYSLRITRKCRAVAYREEEWLRLLSLHPDHDSACGVAYKPLQFASVPSLPPILGSHLCFLEPGVPPGSTPGSIMSPLRGSKTPWSPIRPGATRSPAWPLSGSPRGGPIAHRGR